MGIEEIQKVTGNNVCVDCDNKVSRALVLRVIERMII